MNTTMNRDKILHFASHTSGFLKTWDDGESLDRKVGAMVSEGLLVKNSRTVSIPAYEGEARAHAGSMGLNPDAHDATIVTFTLTDAGRSAWLKGA